MAKQPDRVLGPGAQGDIKNPGDLVAPEPSPKKKTESKEDDK